VVLSEDGGSILVQGEDFAEVATAVEEAGLADTVIEFIPRDWGPRVVTVFPLRAR
jgi:hypothetical protein